MILFPKTPLVEYIQLYESENMHFGWKDFDNFIPSNRNFVQFSILFSVILKGTNCSQNYTLSVFTKDFIKNYDYKLYGKSIEIDTFINCNEIKTYIENIINNRIYGSCNDLKKQLSEFFTPTDQQNLELLDVLSSMRENTVKKSLKNFIKKQLA